MEAAAKVPCHAEFFKYLQWHNNAFYATDEAMDIPTLVVHYEDFATDFEGTLKGLLDFYGLPMEGEPMEFHFHTYDGYYTDQERTDTVDFLKLLASPTTWENLSPYVGKKEKATPKKAPKGEKVDGAAP